ncbi:MAG: pitrilysin family protein [Vicinamibacterales bacterium]
MSRVDRSRLPVPGADRPFHFPRLARRRLANGLELRAATHRSVPIVSMVLLVPGGSSVNPPGMPGLASMLAGLLDEGSRGQSALDVADRVARIGGDLDLETGSDAHVISFTTLDRFFDTGVSLIHEIVTAPNLTPEDFNRVRNHRVERLRQIKDHAAAVADRAFAQTLYATHPYGSPGVGTEAALSAMTADDVRALHAALLVPAGSTLIVVGDRPEEELLDTVEKTFAGWQAGPATMTIDRAAALVPPPAMPVARLAVVSRPGAAQSELRIGHACAARSTPDYHALLTLNNVLGGAFVSRLNLNLREAKGYTYGVRTGFELRRGIGPFVMQTSVATSATADAVRESLKELGDIAGARPVTPDELSMAKDSVSKGYPRGFETASQVARSIAQLALHGLPDSYFEDFIPQLTAITAADVTRAAQKYLDLGRMTTVVVGDLDTISGPLASLQLGEPRVVRPEF